MKFARVIRAQLSYKDLPLTLLSLALAIFAAAVVLSDFESKWFNGTQFIGSCVLSGILVITDSAIYVAELIVFRSGISQRHIEETSDNLWQDSDIE
jgi:hypothetical protein